jgi:hypothetical protein
MFKFVAQVDPGDFAHEVATDTAVDKEEQMRNTMQAEAFGHLRAESSVERGKGHPVAIHFYSPIKR